MNISKILFCIVLIPIFLQAQDNEKKLKDTFDSFVKSAKGVWDGAGNMLKGMGQSFGVIGKEYVISSFIVNDAPAPIFVAEEKLTGLLGATFQGEINKGLSVGPFSNSGEEFYERHLYVSMWLCADKELKSTQHYPKNQKEWLAMKDLVGQTPMGVASPIVEALGTTLGPLAKLIGDIAQLNKFKLLKKDIYPWPKDDHNIYFYRTYTYKGEIRAEYLDLKGTTSDLTAQFYNTTDQPIIMNFEKDEKEYTVTLEADAFASLASSQKDFSLRPKQGVVKGFTFYTQEKKDENAFAYMPLAPLGIGNIVNVSNDPQKPQLVVSGSMVYTYEIYKLGDQLTVGMQGLSIGHYDQPVNKKVRDINPLECWIWYVSATQEQKREQKENEKPDYNAVPFDQPGQLWLTYKTVDSFYQQKINSGQTITFNILRPQFKEKTAWLYGVYIQTQEDEKAKKFLDRLNAGIIGVKAVSTDVSKPLDTTQLLQPLQPNINGLVDDTQGSGSTGLQGYVLFADVFTPQGLSDGPFYYQINPPLLRIDEFANAIWFDNDWYQKDVTGSLVLKESVLQELSTLLPSWITQYQKDAIGAQRSLETYLKQKANRNLFVDPTQPTANKTFTNQGKELVKTLTTGPISLKNYPLMTRSGTNFYIFTFGQKPENWPT